MSFTRLIVTLLTLCAVLLQNAVSAAERHYLVEYRKIDKSSEYRVLTKDELKELKDQTKARSRHYSKAVTAAKKEWKENSDRFTGSFPSVQKEKVAVKGEYSDRESAQKKISKYLEREAEKAKEDKTSHALKVRGKYYQKMKGRTLSVRDKARFTEKIKQATAEPAMDDKARMMAAGLIEQKIKALMEPEPEPPAP